MKECCKIAIKNYKRNEVLSGLQDILVSCRDLNKKHRLLLKAFIEGMKNN